MTASFSFLLGCVGAGCAKMPEWPTDRDSYVLGPQIGQGAFAEVYVATCKCNGEQVAIKIMELEKILSNFEEIRKEVRVSLCSYISELFAGGYNENDGPQKRAYALMQLCT